jgi:TetR/AcrR family transcriptional regulator, mexJK operon transcriptional repressor
MASKLYQRHAGDPVSTPRRPGRPSINQSAAITGTIINGARALFLREGYSATSMEAIAAHTGISKGTLYTRFANKEALFAALVEDRVQAWARRADTFGPPPEDGLKRRLEHHVAIILDCIVDPEVAAFGRMLSVERDRFPELERIYRDRALTHSIEILARDIELGARELGYTIQNPRDIAFALIEAAWGWANVRLSGNARHEPGLCRIAASRIVERLMGGIASW